MDAEERLDLIMLLANDKGWACVVAVGRAVLAHHYPADVFDGSSGNTGPAYIVALREALAKVTTS